MGTKKIKEKKENKKQTFNIMMIFLAFFILCIVLAFVFSSNTSNSDNASNSEPKTCDEAVRQYLDKIRPLCSEVEYERSRYKRVPDSMERNLWLTKMSLDSDLSKKFGEECSKQFNDILVWNLNCL